MVKDPFGALMRLIVVSVLASAHFYFASSPKALVHRLTKSRVCEGMAPVPFFAGHKPG